jgi:hypothetical protein
MNLGYCSTLYIVQSPRTHISLKAKVFAKFVLYFRGKQDRLLQKGNGNLIVP